MAIKSEDYSSEYSSSQDSSSEDEVIVLALLMEAEKQKERKQRKKRLWVHNINTRRREYGEYHTLFPDLLLDDTKFFAYFRMTHNKFLSLLDLLREHLTRENSRFRTSISPQERLSVCLRFLATGNSFRSLAFTFCLGESTEREIIYTTCKSIWEILSPIVMPVPDGPAWIAIEKGFREKWDFPNAIGALDGKHILMQAPPHSGSIFFSYKKTFSTVLLALVDANKKFIMVDVGAYGKNSDGSIFRNSEFGKQLSSGMLNLPPAKSLTDGGVKLPHVIVADAAFPLRDYLMRPYSRKDIENNDTAKIFNYRLSRARNVVENTFGIMVKKFRLFERRLNMSHEHVICITLAVCCLHNLLREDTCYWTDHDLDVDESYPTAFNNIRNVGGACSTDALEVRDQFKEYFNSAVGALEWQLRRVRAGKRLPE